MMKRMIRRLSMALLVGTLATPALSAQYSRDQVQSAIEQLGYFNTMGSRNAGMLLIDAGKDAVPQLQTELRSVTEIEKRITDNTSEEAERTATRKIQLLNILGEIGEFSSAQEIITCLRQTSGDHMAQKEGFAALTKLGPAQITLDYAEEILNSTTASIFQKWSAFTPLEQYPQPSMAALAETYAAESATLYLRDRAILLGARLGLKDSMLPLIEKWLRDPVGDYGDYNVLLALAELVPPTEFESKVAGVSIDTFYKNSATRYNRFKWADTNTRSTMLDTMIGSRFHEELLLALSHLLEHGSNELLKDKGILNTTPNQPDNLTPMYRPFVQILGYRYDGQGRFERMFNGEPVQAP